MEWTTYSSSGKVSERRVHVRPGELRPVHRRRRRNAGVHPAAASAVLPRVVGRVRRVLVAVPTAACTACADVRRLIDPRAGEDCGDLRGLLGAEHRRRRRRRGGRLRRGMHVVIPRMRVVVGQRVAVAAVVVDPVEVGGGGAVVDNLQNCHRAVMTTVTARVTDAPSSSGTDLARLVSKFKVRVADRMAG